MKKDAKDVNCASPFALNTLWLCLKNLTKKGYHPATQINPEECTGCAFCAMTCPDVAIEVFK